MVVALCRKSSNAPALRGGYFQSGPDIGYPDRCAVVYLSPSRHTPCTGPRPLPVKSVSNPSFNSNPEATWLHHTVSGIDIVVQMPLK